jgi:predicted HTH transcriptional regulator
LLAAAEETHLDFKASVDFANTKDRVEFVKDAVTMANRPPGGYIIIGVDNSGSPCISAGTLPKPRQFDGANLNQQVRKFIEAETHIVSQIHEIDGHDFVLVWIHTTATDFLCR